MLHHPYLLTPHRLSSQLLCELSILTLFLLQSFSRFPMGPLGVSSDWRSFKKDVFFYFISGSRKLLSELFTLFSIQDFFRYLVWLESSNICFWIFWLNVARYFLHWSCQRFIFVFDWSFYTGRFMLYDDSIILIVNIFRVISFDNLIHIIVLRLCFVRTRRDLLDWFIFFSSLCVSFFLVSPQLSKWFPDTLSESRTAGCAGKIHRFVVH